MNKVPNRDGPVPLDKLGKGKLYNIFEIRRSFCSRKTYFTNSFAIDVVAVLVQNAPSMCVPRLNPIESFWGWLRGELRRRDLKDLRLQKPALNKVQYKQRVKEVLRTIKAQDVAKAKFRNLKKVCKEVVKKKGAMSRQ